MNRHVAPGQVALTFDDGPDPLWSRQLLDALGRKGAVATFFLIGERAGAHPELVEAMIESGHEAALHCDMHLRHSSLSRAQIRADAERGLEALDRLGVRPRAWRTPWGDVTEQTRSVASELELELWGWSHDTHDWRGDAAASMLAAIGDEGLEGGSVALMHDGLGPGARRAGCEQTVRVTEALLDRAAQRGLRPVTLSESGGAR